MRPPCTFKWTSSQGRAALLLVALATGCAGSATATVVHEGALDASGVAHRIDCLDPVPLDGHVAPIHGGAATGGIECQLDGRTVHLFDAAGVGQASTRFDYSDLLGLTDEPSGGCDAVVFAGQGLIVVAPESHEEQLEAAAGGRMVVHRVSGPPHDYPNMPC